MQMRPGNAKITMRGWGYESYRLFEMCLSREQNEWGG